MNTDLSKPKSYTLFEDIQGLMIGSTQATLGIHLLREAGLMTGGTAGMALLLAYAMDWNFSLVFFLVNIPFYLFAWMARGPIFCAKSLATVTMVSLMAQILAPLLPVDGVHLGAAAILFGISTGVGLLGLFRHQGSLGGVSIMALIAQDKLGWKAGWVQLGHDLILFGFAVIFFPLTAIAWSLLGAVILNAVITFNHRRDWYVVN